MKMLLSCAQTKEDHRSPPIINLQVIYLQPLSEERAKDPLAGRGTPNSPSMRGSHLHFPQNNLLTDRLQEKRIFIKDIIHYLLPPNGKPASIAPSLHRIKRGVGTSSTSIPNVAHSQTNGTVNGTAIGHRVEPNGVDNASHRLVDATLQRNGTLKQSATTSDHSENCHPCPYPYKTEPEPGNPTVMPRDLLAGFHFAFLIRDPHYSTPSYYRCTIEPLVNVTGWYTYDPAEAGYDEVRRTFDYLRKTHLIGPRIATRGDCVLEDIGDEPRNISAGVNGASGINGTHAGLPYDSGVEICVIDADDLLDKPAQMIEAFCRSVGLAYDPAILTWDTDEDQRYAKEVFEKWNGFHDDAINSSELRPRAHARRVKTEAQFDAEWRERYGDEAAALIRKTVDANMADYLYMKQFAMKV